MITGKIYFSNRIWTISRTRHYIRYCNLLYLVGLDVDREFRGLNSDSTCVEAVLAGLVAVAVKAATIGR